MVWRDISNRSVATVVDKGVYLDMTCFYIPINDTALCSWMHSDFYLELLRTISSSVRGDALRWKKQWIQQTYFYPKELKNELERIYDLSIKNPSDGVSKLNRFINEFLE